MHLLYTIINALSTISNENIPFLCLQIIKFYNRSIFGKILHENKSYYFNVNDGSQEHILFQGYLTNFQCQGKDH